MKKVYASAIVAVALVGTGIGVFAPSGARRQVTNGPGITVEAAFYKKSAASDRVSAGGRESVAPRAAVTATRQESTGHHNGRSYRGNLKEQSAPAQNSQSGFRDIIPPLDLPVTYTSARYDFTGTLSTPDHITLDGYGKWDSITILNEVGGTGNPKTYIFTLSNGRILHFIINANEYNDATTRPLMLGWVNRYIAANTRVPPPYPIGSFWNNGQRPTSWDGFGAVGFVFSNGWVFVYWPGSGKGSTNPALPPGNSYPPTAEDIRYSQQVMRGDIELG